MKNSINKIDIELVTKLLSYNSETGEITNKCNRGRARQGSSAVQWLNNGYGTVTIKGVRYGAARVAYALHHCEDPGDLEVDHINHDRQDNRACNLRTVTRQVNASNRSIKARGVSFCKRAQKWRAQVQHMGMKVSCGYHECPLLARVAFEDKRVELGIS